jgi:hypothetical protein
LVPGGKYIIKNVVWSKQYRFWPLGDLHWGARGCDEDLLDRTIARIKSDPHSRWIGMGDYWDLITPQDRRFDPAAVSPRHRKAYFEGMSKSMLEYAYEKLAPIRRKCMGILEGNHEFSHNVKMDSAMSEDLADSLGAPFLGYSCFKDIVFQRGDKELSIRVFAHHGAGAAATEGGKINRLQKFIDMTDADIVLMGHVHTPADLPSVVLGANFDCSKIEAHVKLGVISGTYLKTYKADRGGSSSYGERKGYKPVVLGSPCIIIEPGAGRVMVEKPMGRLGGRNARKD